MTRNNWLVILLVTRDGLPFLGDIALLSWTIHKQKDTTSAQSVHTSNSRSRFRKAACISGDSSAIWTEGRKASIRGNVSKARGRDGGHEVKNTSSQCASRGRRRGEADLPSAALIAADCIYRGVSSTAVNPSCLWSARKTLTTSPAKAVKRAEGLRHAMEREAIYVVPLNMSQLYIEHKRTFYIYIVYHGAYCIESR
jgi:hypothetical protein